LQLKSLIYTKPYQRITAITQTKDSLFTAFYDTKKIFTSTFYIYVLKNTKTPLQSSL